MLWNLIEKKGFRHFNELISQLSMLERFIVIFIPPRTGSEWCHWGRMAAPSSVKCGLRFRTVGGTRCTSSTKWIIIQYRVSKKKYLYPYLSLIHPRLVCDKLYGGILTLWELVPIADVLPRTVFVAEKPVLNDLVSKYAAKEGRYLCTPALRQLCRRGVSKFRKQKLPPTHWQKL